MSMWVIPHAMSEVEGVSPVGGLVNTPRVERLVSGAYLQLCESRPLRGHYYNGIQTDNVEYPRSHSHSCNVRKSLQIPNGPGTICSETGIACINTRT